MKDSNIAVCEKQIEEINKTCKDLANYLQVNGINENTIDQQNLLKAAISAREELRECLRSKEKQNER